MVTKLSHGRFYSLFARSLALPSSDSRFAAGDLGAHDAYQSPVSSSTEDPHVTLPFVGVVAYLARAAGS